MDESEMKLLREISEHCCKKCEYDEADGLLYSHCNACCRWITTRLFEFTHKQKPMKHQAAAHIGKTMTERGGE